MDKNTSDTFEPLDRSVPPRVQELSGIQYPLPERSILPNGVELVILRNGAQPVNRITLEWRVGSADVDDVDALSVMMSMLGEATAPLSGAEIAEILEYNGAWKGVDWSRHSASLSVYMLNEGAVEIFPVIRAIVAESVFPPEVFNALRERRAAMAELAWRKPDKQVLYESMRQLYGEEAPVAAQATPEGIRALDPAKVRDLYDALIRGTRPVVYLCGDITPEIAHMAAGIFGAIPYPSSGMEARFIPAISHSESDTRRVDMPESLQTAVRFAVPLPGMGFSHPDYETLRIAVRALGGYFGSRLMMNIREDKGYTYGIQAYIGANHEGAFMIISTQTDNAYVEGVLEEIEKEIALLAGEPMPEEELASVRGNMVSSIASLMETPFSLTDYYRQLDSIPLPLSHLSRQLEAISSVTPELIRDVARRWLLDAPRLVTLAGPNPLSAGTL